MSPAETRGCTAGIRCCLTLAALFSLAGCSSENSSNTSGWKDYYEILRQATRNGFSKPGISRDEAANIPYSSLGYRVDGSAEHLLVLATDNNGEQLWTAASRVVLLTNGGRLAHTIGLPHDRSYMAPRNGARPELSAALKGSYRSSWLADFPDLGRYGVLVNCVTTARGRQTISILDTNIATRRIDESCSSTQLRWSYTDNYWIDEASGFAWHSIQHLHPAGTVLQIEILRPPA